MSCADTAGVHQDIHESLLRARKVADIAPGRRSAARGQPDMEELAALVKLARETMK
jgi:hypothetical protein